MDQASASPAPADTRSPPPSAPPTAFRRFRLTQYWIAPLSPGDVVLLDPSGVEIARVSADSKRNLDLEGTGRLPDGRVLNVSGAGRYRVLPVGWQGTGAGGRRLTPFMSVAVDLGTQGGKKMWKDPRIGALLPVGTRLYIKELDGVRLPDGTTHDGWVTAEDTGDAIFGAHLDFFVGDKTNRLRHPDIVTVWFEGSDQIPADYVYGLTKPDNYRAGRPPGERAPNA